MCFAYHPDLLLSAAPEASEASEAADAPEAPTMLAPPAICAASDEPEITPEEVLCRA
jgi:hypothetical protein